MKKEVKICLPVYKVVYSITFMVLLSLVRGIVYLHEIGIAMDSAIAVLSIVFCADTYLTELHHKREEVFHLYTRKRRTIVIFRRFAVQTIYLIGISILGYGLFYWQKPITYEEASPFAEYGMFLIAIIGTVLFWGALSMTVSNLFRNTWAGIGSSLVIWFGLVSRAGSLLLGKWNVFSYTFREIGKMNDWSWMCGKAVSLLAACSMLAAIPFILRKRS